MNAIIKKREKIHFFLFRLKNSSVAELIWRTRQLLFALALKKRLQKCQNIIHAPDIHTNNLKSLQLPTINGKPNDQIVEKILSGYTFSLNINPGLIEEFGKTYNPFLYSKIPSSESYTDIRAVWEPARLQHLAILLQYISQAEKSCDVRNIEKFVKNSVLDWIRKNPFLYGPHYISAMECGLRIPVFFYCLKNLNILSASENKLILDAVYQHAWWISNRLSLYSSLGNHTIAESVGLIYAGVIFGNTREGCAWLGTGRKLLQQEIDHQILEDGGPAEQSFNYHRFVLDLYWLAVDFLEKNGFHNCRIFKERLKQGERFIKAFESIDGSLPQIGDSDDGHAIAPELYPRRRIPAVSNKQIQTFPASGYTVIRCNHSILTFDHGPLGMAPLYNHGHADALSVTLSVNGQKMLVDPGTYRYNGESEFRKYFKGTRAHSTVTIDGLDQAVQETGFIWGRPYRANLVKSTEMGGGFFLQASHDGYMKTEKPVRHFRSIFGLDGAHFIIKDTFLGKGVHSFELNYHVHPDAQATMENNACWKIACRGEAIFIGFLDEDIFSIINGQRNPLLGWYSPSYGVKRESAVLNCTKRGIAQEIRFVTCICINLPPELGMLTKRLSEIERQIENP